MKKILFLSLTVSFSCAIGQTSLSEKDTKFVNAVVDGGMLEVKLGQLAQTNGSAPEVKNLGSMMVTDHTKAGNELTALATKNNVSTSSALSPKAQMDYDKLSKKHGKDFDKAYTKCTIKMHKKTICKFKEEAKKGDNSELKTWASNTLPTLEHHEQMAKETCAAVKKEK